MNSVERGFDYLRISVESRLAAPSIVTVTAALPEDGSAIVAAGLAESLADAGKTTLLVTGNVAAVGTRSNGRANLTRSTAQQLTADVRGGRAALGSVVATLRENYDFIVVDAEPIPTSTIAYEMARTSDAVLVAIRLGRKPTREDRTTMKLLDDCNANVLGIVPTGGPSSSTSRSGSLGPSADGDTVGLRTQRQIEVTR